MKSLHIMSCSIFFKFVKWLSAIAILTLSLSSSVVGAQSKQNSLSLEDATELSSISVGASSAKSDIKEAARDKTKAIFKKAGGDAAVQNLIARSKNDSTLFGSLNKDEQKAVTAYSIVFDTVSDTKIESNQNSRRGRGETARNFGSFCTTNTSWSVGQNSLGNWLFKYSQQIFACYNGNTLTTAYRQNRWAEVYVPGWQFTGHAGNWERGGPNRWEFVAWTQGNFQFCIAGWGIGCLQFVYPWVQQWIRGNGASG